MDFDFDFHATPMGQAARDIASIREDAGDVRQVCETHVPLALAELQEMNRALALLGRRLNSVEDLLAKVLWYLIACGLVVVVVFLIAFSR